MPSEEVSRTEIRQFRGMASVIDPDDLSPEVSRTQTNCLSLRTGELTTRPGLESLLHDDSEE